MAAREPVTTVDPHFSSEGAAPMALVGAAWMVCIGLRDGHV